MDTGSAVAGAIRVSAWSLLENRDRLVIGDQTAPNALGEEVRIQRHFVDLQYIIDEEWSVSATLSYVDIRRKLAAAGLREKISGVGDTLVAVHWTPIKDDLPEDADLGAFLQPLRWRLGLTGGWTIPTGQPRQIAGSPGVPMSLLQTGSGTFQPVLGISARADWGGLAATGDAWFTLPFYANRNDYRGGLSGRVALGFEVCPVDWARIRLAVDARVSGRDILDGETLDTGGGTRLSFHPRIVINPTDSMAFFVGVDVPFYVNVPERTLETDFTLEAGFSLTF
jgi:hypothetical protein